MHEHEKIEKAVLSWDPACYHDRSGLVLLQKKNMIRSFDNDTGFSEKPCITQSWYEVVDIQVLKGDYLQQSDKVVEIWAKFQRWYRERGLPLHLLIDAAGVGVSVKMTLRNRAELAGLSIPVKGYTFVSSIMPSKTSHSILRLDKPSVYEFAYRIAANGQLKIHTGLPLARELKREMENLNVVQSPSGRPLINAPAGEWDDLCTATVAALAFMDLRGGVRAIDRIPGL